MTDTFALDPARVAPEPGNPAVADVMRDEVVFCLPSTSIDAVAKLMVDNDLSEVPVLIDRRPVGYVAAQDIVDRLVEGDITLGGSDLLRPSVTGVTARDLLRTPLLQVDESSPMEDVLALMRQQGRTTALVTHEDERPVGMLTSREVAAHLVRRAALGATRHG